MANPQQFAMQYGPVAAQVGQRLGVDPTILLGQWGLETGWGKSVVPGTNNLGNIKDFSGGGVGATDNMTGSRDNYRQFDTPEAFGDHFAGLIERKYPNAVGTGGDPQAFAQALRQGGYAEDPAYVNKVAAVTNTVRKQPGVVDQIAAAIFPAAQAGTLPSGRKVDIDPQALNSLQWEDIQPAAASKKVDVPPDVLGSLNWESIPPDAPGEPSAERQGGYGQQIASGFVEGVTGLLGAPVDLTNAAIGLGMRGINSAFGTDFQPSQTPLGGSAGLRQGLQIAPPSSRAGPQIARRVAQSVGGSVIPVAAGARTAGQLAAGLGTAMGGGVGGAVAQQAFPGNLSAEILGETLGGLGTGASISGLANRSARRTAEKAVPTVEQLKSQASEKFDEAHRLGVTASQPQTQKLADDIRGVAQQEGLISPTGRVSEAYPKAREAIRMLDDYAVGDMSVPQMQTVRKVLADAAGSSDAAERRIATMMLKQFDDFTAPLAPQLAQARGLYARAMKGDQLETLSELAGSRAGQFTGSGYENALRTEYRNLDRRIKKGQERGWTPEQKEAISKVAQGTASSNVLRGIGKMARTGVVSYGLSGGVPFMIGNAIGGPALGGALSGATMGSGFLARDAATRLGMKYANAAETLARNGGLLPAALRDDLYPALLGGALGGQLGIRSD